MFNADELDLSVAFGVFEFVESDGSIIPITDEDMEGYLNFTIYQFKQNITADYKARV